MPCGRGASRGATALRFRRTRSLSLVTRMTRRGLLGRDRSSSQLGRVSLRLSRCRNIKGQDIVEIASTNLMPETQISPLERLGPNCDTIAKVARLVSHSRAFFIGCSRRRDCCDRKSYSVGCLITSVHKSSSAIPGSIQRLYLVCFSHDDWR